MGYFFGRQLYESISVPIGLIDDSWGGSACEAWIRRDLLEKDDRFQPLMEAWVKRENSLPEAKERYQKQRAEFQEAAAKAKSEGSQPPRPPQDPDGQMRGNARPGNIYNGVLKPTIGYGIRGAIWYQGESNAGRAYQYRDLFPLMIQSWRDEWGIGDFSFYWVQLADFLPERPTPGDSQWAELREAQTMTMSKLPKTGEAVIIDLGEAKDIRPRNKLDVAKRLARWALAKDYGVPIAYQSPSYKSMEKNGNKITITLDHIGGGLRPWSVAEVKGFYHRQRRPTNSCPPRPSSWAATRLKSGPTKFPTRPRCATRGPITPFATCTAWRACPSRRSAPTTGRGSPSTTRGTESRPVSPSRSYALDRGRIPRYFSGLPFLGDECTPAVGVGRYAGRLGRRVVRCRSGPCALFITRRNKVSASPRRTISALTIAPSGTRNAASALMSKFESRPSESSMPKARCWA